MNRTYGSRYNLLTSQEARYGLFAMLKLEHLPNKGEFLGAHPWMGEGVDGHPVCIVGLKDNNSIACCLTVTSFNNTSIGQKFRDPQDLFHKQYVAVDHGNATLGALRLANNQRMLKQSYVHLDGFFEIETRYLESFYGNAKFLSQESADSLINSFTDFLEGRIPRPEFGRGGVLSPLDTGATFTPVSLGLPVHRLTRRGSSSSLASTSSEEDTLLPAVSVWQRASHVPVPAWSFAPAPTPIFVRPRSGNAAIQIVRPDA